MTNDLFTFLVGGKAGEGVKKAGSIASHLFSSMGRSVFEMSDYQSLIRGGHNFTAVSTAVGAVTSHHMRADLVVALDARSYENHAAHLSDRGLMIYNSDAIEDADGLGVPITMEAKKYPNPALRVGVSAPASLAAAIGLTKDEMAKLIADEYRRDIEINVAYASSIYDIVAKAAGGRFGLARGDRRRPILSGNEAIALGAAAGGLDVYIAYPMTPSSTILHYLAKHDRELGVTVVHPESEIAVANMAVGAASVGARTAVGSSGGGFALMEEALSLAGMAESPLLCVLSSRPGPSTGVPTYTEQADLRFALNQGHGEFPRIVASPGTVEEAFYLAAQMLSLVWRFQTPGILLTEKHMSESSMTVDIDPEAAEWAEPLQHSGGQYKRYLDTAGGISPMLFPPSEELIKWNSYEHDEAGITTEDPNDITAMHDKRTKKQHALIEHLRGVRTVNTYGDSGPIIFAYGSTTMSVLEALRFGEIEATVVQPVFLEPLPVWELEQYRGSDPLVVEQSSTGQFATLLGERAGIEAKGSIRKYDGRPFDPDDLAVEIKKLVG